MDADADSKVKSEFLPCEVKKFLNLREIAIKNTVNLISRFRENQPGACRRRLLWNSPNSSPTVREGSL
jgi:hypothetical protein